jgi:hypothetical protein
MLTDQAITTTLHVYGAHIPLLARLLLQFGAISENSLKTHHLKAFYLKRSSWKH